VSVGEVRRFLIRAALDEVFLGLCRTDPVRAMEGFELSEEERGALRRQEPDLLMLLGQAVREGMGMASEAAGDHAVEDEAVDGPIPDQGTPSASPAPVPVALPDVVFAVRLTPQATWSQTQGLQVSYSATIEPLPAAAPAPGPAPAPPAPAPAPPPALDQAVQAVFAAAPDDQLARVLDLLELMTSPTRG